MLACDPPRELPNHEPYTSIFGYVRTRRKYCAAASLGYWIFSDFIVRCGLIYELSFFVPRALRGRGIFLRRCPCPCIAHRKSLLSVLAAAAAIATTKGKEVRVRHACGGRQLAAGEVLA